MSSSCSYISTLEELPDEILLLICRYLSSVDVLFSFYGLNSRLSRMISGYCRHVVLAQIPFVRFNYICTSILPNIGANICSLVVSNEWTAVLSKIFLSQFGERISLVFPRLKHLTLIAFITKSLTLFIDCLQNLTELSEITIHGLFAEFNHSNESQTLLDRILVTNNNRLNSIKFDCFSTAFPVDAKNNGISFPNIEKLHINLKTIHDLHRLLTILPRLRCLYTKIHEQSFEFHEQNEYIKVPSLKYFHLQSFCLSWNLDQLASVLKRIPNVEELSVEIDSYDDIGLLDGHQMFSLLSVLSLKKFTYFLRINNSSSIDHTKILSTWQQFNQELVCIKDENSDRVMLYTLPFIFDDLILRCSLAKKKPFSDSYAPQVRLLYLYEVSTHISEIFSTISKCYRLHDLCLQIDKHVVSKSFQQNQLWKLPYLTKLTISGTTSINIEDFQKLIEGLPNLYDLNISSEFLHPLLNNESVCLMIKPRITHLCITTSSSDTLESIISSISRLASVFSSLKYLYFWIKIVNQSSELLIMTVFNYLFLWNCLIAFVTVGIKIKPEILTKGIRQWVLENSSLRDNDSFIADYFEERFRLWL